MSKKTIVIAIVLTIARGLIRHPPFEDHLGDAGQLAVGLMKRLSGAGYTPLSLQNPVGIALADL